MHIANPYPYIAPNAEGNGNSAKGLGVPTSHCLYKVWNNIIRSEEIGIQRKTNRARRNLLRPAE